MSNYKREYNAMVLEKAKAIYVTVNPFISSAKVESDPNANSDIH